MLSARELGCRFGAANAPAKNRAIVIGDSIAISWLPGVRKALEPKRWQVLGLTWGQCPTPRIDNSVLDSEAQFTPLCGQHQQWALDEVMRQKPALVIMASAENTLRRLPCCPDLPLASSAWRDAQLATAKRPVSAGGRVVILAPPPEGKSLAECATRLNQPEACVTRVSDQWQAMSDADIGAAKGAGATYVDASAWFCDAAKVCPSFVGTTTVFADGTHLTSAYSAQLAPQLATALLPGAEIRLGRCHPRTPFRATAASFTANIPAMAVRSSLAQRARVAARVALGSGLKVVPLRVIEAARDRHVLVPILRHRSLTGLGVITVTGTPPIRLAAVDSRLLRMLYWHGEDGYEAHEVYWWRHFCRHAEGILEIGANVGYYTVQGALAAPSVPYTTVEAHPESAEIVRRNLDLNSITHVEVIQAAVVGSSDVATVELALPELEKYVAPTGAFVTQTTEGVEARRPSTRSITVPAISADSLLAGVDLVKLDIEGSEHLVLSPIIDSLTQRRATILVEVLRDTPKLRDLLARLADSGYRYWLVSGSALQEITKEQLLSDDLYAVYGCRDLAAIPGEREDMVAG